MYDPARDMNTTDFAVSRAIKELAEQRQQFSQLDIAYYIGCTEKTVNVSCQRLVKTGVVEMISLGGRGFTYRFITDKRLEVLASA